MFSVLEKQEEEKTEGRATHQFRQAIVDATDTAKKNLQFLKNEFKDEIHTSEGKRDEAAKILKEIEKVRGEIAKCWGKRARKTKQLRRKQNCTNISCGRT